LSSSEKIAGVASSDVFLLCAVVGLFGHRLLEAIGIQAGILRTGHDVYIQPMEHGHRLNQRERRIFLTSVACMDDLRGRCRLTACTVGVLITGDEILLHGRRELQEKDACLLVMCRSQVLGVLLRTIPLPFFNRKMRLFGSAIDKNQMHKRPSGS
jgi:hypothetical protein